MALNSGKILMRRGQEANFDPNKMIPGEWAVSLDSKFVRMCFSPGVCIRMATYEAFEADMEQIKAILDEAKTVESAVIRINNEVSDKLDAVVEYTGQAKTYRDQALQYRNDAERFRNETQQIAGGNFLTPESAVSFTEATSRSNITTTDTVKIILGKIKKFFTDLKPHAFSNPTNNLLATVAGTALDAVQGKALNDRITQLSDTLDNVGSVITGTGTSVSIPTGVTTKLASITIPAGTYIINASVLFSGNTNGMRGITISSAASVNATNVISNGVSANPWTNLSTRVRYSSHIEYTKETVVSVYGYQNSGSDLIAESAAIAAVRVK